MSYYRHHREEEPALTPDRKRRQKQRIEPRLQHHDENGLYAWQINPWRMRRYRNDLLRLESMCGRSLWNHCQHAIAPAVKKRIAALLMARSVEDRRVLCRTLGIPLSLENKPLL